MAGENRSIARYTFVLIACVLVLGLAGCGTTLHTDSALTGKEIPEASPLEIVGVFHPSTGMYDPETFTGADYDTIVSRLTDSELEDDKKTVFVAINMKADGEDNTEIPIQVDGVGNRVSGADLIVGNNKYDDTWAYNQGGSQKGFAEKLSEIGYADGAGGVTLYGGSDDSYKAIFMFFISNHDYKSGGTARLTWNGMEADVNLASMVEVATPSDIVTKLSE